eukprot:85237-Amphidinium_carterae.1
MSAPNGCFSRHLGALAHTLEFWGAVRSDCWSSFEVQQEEQLCDPSCSVSRQCQVGYAENFYGAEDAAQEQVHQLPRHFKWQLEQETMFHDSELMLCHFIVQCK